MNLITKISNGLVILVTKATAGVLKLLNRKGGNVPGRVALMLKKNVRDGLAIDGKIIVVTGTNGKTTTTSILAQALRAAGKRVVVNEGGNNIDWGITTTLLSHASLGGRICADYVILETDEHWVPVIFAKPNLAIDTLVVLNFFRDQLDRAGEMETIIGKLEKFVAEHPCKLVLNDDDPNVVRIGRENTGGENYYFGARRLPSSYTTPRGKMEGIICPYCQTPLTYEYYQYSHIGAFCCEKCGYKNAPRTTEATRVEGADFYVDGEKYQTRDVGLYNIYNMLAVLTVLDIYGVAREIAAEVFSGYENRNGRRQEFEIGGKKVILNLCKNPIGANVILQPLKGGGKTGGGKAHEEGREPVARKELLLILNDKVNDGHDVSWIWDVDFSEMGGFEKIVCAGTRAYDMAIPVKCNGFPVEKMVVEHEIAAGIRELLKDPGDKYVISNYSGLMEAKETLEKMERAGEQR